MSVPSSEDKPHSHGKYLAVITLLALLVVALGGVAGYYYINRTIVQAAKTAPPTLTTKLYSQQVSFTPWNDTVTFTSSSTYSCSNGQTIPGTIIMQAENFTENLSGRDPGSTWVNFKTANGPPVVFNRADLTTRLITDALCGTTSLAEAAKVVGSSPMWRVLSSGNYTLLIFYIAYTTPVTTPFPGGVVSESWTVTTISTD